MNRYIPTFSEELANTVSHGVMAIVTLLLIPYAAVSAFVEHGVLGAFSVSAFTVSIFLMFLISTLYHAMESTSRHKEVFHVLDHIFIYVAIAGTYTPVALCVIGGWKGVLITALQWAMVIFGALYKSLAKRSIAWLSLTIYMVMGWSVVFVTPTFIRNGSAPLLWLILVGGLFYSVGAYFYARKGFKQHHLVWHLCINLALASHYTAILLYL